MDPIGARGGAFGNDAGEPPGTSHATGLMMGTARTDAELVSAIASGDREALRALHDLHTPWLTGRLRRRCADDDVVREAVQDTFVAVWRGAAGWDGRGEPAAWMWGIAIRRLIGVLRSRGRWLPVAGHDDSELIVAAEDRVLEGIEHGDLAGAMASLSPELRVALQATVLDGLTSREAGRLLGIPTGTVKTRVMRAKQQLRGALA